MSKLPNRIKFRGAEYVLDRPRTIEHNGAKYVRASQFVDLERNLQKFWMDATDNGLFGPDRYNNYMGRITPGSKDIWYTTLRGRLAVDEAIALAKSFGLPATAIDMGNDLFNLNILYGFYPEDPDAIEWLEKEGLNPADYIEGAPSGVGPSVPPGGF